MGFAGGRAVLRGKQMAPPLGLPPIIARVMRLQTMYSVYWATFLALRPKVGEISEWAGVIGHLRCRGAVPPTF